MKALTTFSALALMAVASPAYAQSWTGCYIGAQAGYSSTKTDTDLNLTDGKDTLSLLGIDGVGTNGGAGGAVAGCDYQINRFVIGAFGDYLWHDQDFKADALAHSASIGYSIDNQWSIGGRVGVLANESTLVYALAAYTEADTSDLEWKLGAPLFKPDSGSFKADDLKGWSVGGGLETHLTGNLYLAAEYRYTKFDDITTTLYDGKKVDLNLDTETEMHTGLVSLKFKLGRDNAIAAAPLK